jgi:hypothetical protein
LDLRAAISKAISTAKQWRGSVLQDGIITLSCEYFRQREGQEQEGSGEVKSGLGKEGGERCQRQKTHIPTIYDADVLPRKAFLQPAKWEMEERQE